MIVEDPGLSQARAADPAASVWVSANAGSGKTKVLTDRVARLLLAGVDPASVLCLTYTKAAAAEMQVRLFHRLGAWAMMPDAKLAETLRALDAPAAGTEGLARARRLFARAIETPGGLRIQTIHAFCAALLRRFPLEAGVPPQFTELDDRAAARARASVFDALADGGAPEAVARIAALWSGRDVDELLKAIAGQRDAFARKPDPAALRRAFGLAEDDSPARLLAQVFRGDEAEWMPEVVARMATGKDTDRRNADRLAARDFGRPDEDLLEVLEGLFVYGESTKQPGQAKLDRFPTKELRQGMGRVLDPLQALMQRVAEARPRRLALAAMARTAALNEFAAAFLPAYAAHKAGRGWLDFDDLILTARALLTAPGVAPFVLWKLDAGIAHLLVDEAQDTSPAQWAVIEALTEEFAAGAGPGRTLFVVGDRKQSIYSFQGADLDVYDRRQRDFTARLAAAGSPMRQVPLLHSFRSAPAILRLVDNVFAPAQGLPLDSAPHLAFHGEMPGTVDLLAPVEPAPAAEGHSGDLDDVVTPLDPHDDLAAALAARIKAMIERGEPVALRAPGGGTRPMTAGDVLVLLRRRTTPLFGKIIRACKAAGLPVAGTDRLNLSAELAVRDILAVLSFLALPLDDLSLAAALRSPLFGWSEAALFRLAQGREGPLWARLRGQDGEAVAVLRDLRDRAEFLRPHDLIDRLLTRHDGRRRLIARLGAEAEEGIDALLAQSLAYERTEVPSLTGFLAWMEAGEVEVKRRLDAGDGRLRVMTIHGAKGLEAPVVVLPDTGPRRSPQPPPLLALGRGMAWRLPAGDSPPALREALQRETEAREAEAMRLLYVALTRAESRLIVAGIGPMGEPDEEGGKLPPWYRLIQRGMDRSGAVPDGEGSWRLASGRWPATAPARAGGAADAIDLPGWATAPAAPAERPPRPVSPSDLGGAKALPGEEGEATEVALARGTQLHRLLEALPLLAPAEAAAFAAALGAEPALLAEARAVVAAPALAAVFAAGTLAEAEIAADWRGRRLLGAIDRLVVAPDRVLAVDFKSNRIVPARPQDVPEGILRQMGAYAHALAQLYPERRVETAILWTRTASLMPLPHDIVRDALGRATTP